MPILALETLLCENKKIQWKIISSKSKNQVVHEQKFKDLLSSAWQVSVERIVLDLESGAMRGLGSIPTRGNIFHWIFFLFSCSNASYANIGTIAILGISKKLY